jgi:type II secretory pathway pseudopilin PulG
MSTPYYPPTAPGDTPKREFSPRALVVAGIIVTLLLAAIVALLAPKGPSATRRAVEGKLAKLRADGVPVTAEEIGRALPDPLPERDARFLLAEAFNFSTGPVTRNVPVLGEAMPRRGAPIPEEMMQDMEVFLVNSDRLLAAIPDDLTGLRFSVGWTNGFTNRLPSVLIEVRKLQQRLAVKTLYESGRGDGPRAAKSLTKGFAFAASVNGDSLVDAMIRVACAGLMCDVAEQALNRVQFTTEDLQKIDAQVKPEVIDDFSSVFMVERHLGVLTFNHMRERTRGLRGMFINLVQRFKGGNKPVYRDEDYLLFLNFNEQQIKLHSRPLLERVRGYEQITTNFTTNARSQTANMVMPSWSKAMRTAAETKARLVALKTALAIERFRLANNNALPETLDALVPDYCSFAPRDPFDEQPLRYKKLPRGYVVYSIGADGIDNAGAERTNRKNMSDYDLTITVEPER